MACEIDGAGDRGCWGFAGVHTDEIEDGDGKRHRLLDENGANAIQGMPFAIRVC
jgi:hypothetical protein